MSLEKQKQTHTSGLSFCVVNDTDAYLGSEYPSEFISPRRFDLPAEAQTR